MYKIKRKDLDNFLRMCRMNSNLCILHMLEGKFFLGVAQFIVYRKMRSLFFRLTLFTINPDPAEPGYAVFANSIDSDQLA